MMEKRQPHYSLAFIKSLIEKGQFKLSKRVSSHLRSHGFASKGLVEEVFASLESYHYYKTAKLKFLPGICADICRHVPCEGEEWYVKFFLDKSGELSVNVLSMKPDGFSF